MMTVADAASFARLCHEELSREKERESIGLLAEKRLHSVLKRWICDDFATHEQKVVGRGEKKRKITADVLTKEGHIFEIQTGSLFPLQKKIDFYLTQTDHHVTVVHPLVGCKHISRIDSESGELQKRSRSPKKEGLADGVARLRYLAEHLANPRFSVIFPVIEAEEFRLDQGNRRTRRYELVPLKLLDVYRLDSTEDYLPLLHALPHEFTAKQLAKALKLRGYAPYFLLAVLQALGLVQKAGKEGRATLWARSQ